MKRQIIALAGLLLAACSANGITPPSDADSLQAAANPTPLPVMWVAPELTNEVWLNVEEPLRLADLRGKVVLLEMWTFG